jgi:hypothetical protein
MLPHRQVSSIIFQRLIKVITLQAAAKRESEWAPQKRVAREGAGRRETGQQPRKGIGSCTHVLQEFRQIQNPLSAAILAAACCC